MLIYNSVKSLHVGQEIQLTLLLGVNLCPSRGALLLSSDIAVCNSPFMMSMWNVVPYMKGGT